MRMVIANSLRRREASYLPVSDYDDDNNTLRPKGVCGNLVTSIVDRDERRHAPVLDLDYEARLYPSKTAGHWHLELDRELPWWKYRILLRVLSWCGLIEQGYAKASIKRGYSAIHKPLSIRRRTAEDRVKDAWETDPNNDHFWL